jgi:hypothetical protein
VAITDGELEGIMRAIAGWPGLLPLIALPNALGLDLEAASVVTQLLLSQGLATICPSPIGPALALSLTWLPSSCPD